MIVNINTCMYCNEVSQTEEFQVKEGLFGNT